LCENLSQQRLILQRISAEMAEYRRSGIRLPLRSSATFPVNRTTRRPDTQRKAARAAILSAGKAGRKRSASIP
jgi:hypothetical protein